MLNINIQNTIIALYNLKGVHTMAWTDEMVKDLKKMWKDGLTTGEIGRRLGVSKNSVVGKVHRLQLDGRPSPIKKKSDSTPKPVKQTIAQTPPKAEKPAPKPEPVAKTIEPAPKPIIKEKASFIQEREMTTPIICGAHPKNKDGKVTLTNLDNHTCRWPIGDPKDENFHFCGKKARIGQTYCDEHSAIAYVKAGKR